MYMTQNEKDLLLKDLCARLHYGVNMATPYGKGLLTSIRINDSVEKIGVNIDPSLIRIFSADDVKPYLLPLSSMTEEQKEELDKYFDVDSKSLIDGYKNGLRCPHPYFNVQDWYNKKHFDYRGLIPMGLAIDATELNIY